MAKKALLVNKVVFLGVHGPDTKTRLDEVGIMTADVDRILPPDGNMPPVIRSVVRFKRAGVADLYTPHTVGDLVGALNDEIVLTIKTPEPDHV